MSVRSAMRLFVGASLALWIVAAPSAAAAWTPIDSCRPVWSTRPSPYHVNSTGYSRIPFASVLSAFEAAFAEWSRPCCSSWRATYQGTTTGVATDSRNAQNILSFAERAWPGELGSPDSTLAVTLTAWQVDPRSRACERLTADMVFNAANHTFGLSHSFSTVDLQAVTTHEAGHWLGLGHSRVAGATMWPSYTNEGDRSLHGDDETAVCTLYPGDCGCSTTADCDPGEVCTGGTCQPPPCTSNADCDSGLECNLATGACVVPPCRSDADCPGNQVCLGGECTIDADCTTCLPCETIDDCGGGGWQCAGDGVSTGFCTKFCSNGADCPGDSECWGIQGESFSVCLNPDADTAGLCPPSYACTEVVDPCAGVSCPSGQICEGGRCVGIGGSDGCVVCDACSDDDDCPGGGCYSFDGTTTVCALDCGSDADCPSNTTCYAFSSSGSTLNLCMNADFDAAGPCPRGFECAADPCADVRCAGGQTCDPDIGECVGSAEPERDTGSTDSGTDAGGTRDTGGPVGSCPICRSCSDNADCGGGAVCETVGDAGRFCIVDCARDASICPGNTLCFPVAIGDATRSLCLNDDAAAAGICHDGFVCDVRAGQTEDAGTEDAIGDDSGQPWYPGFGGTDGCACAVNDSGRPIVGRVATFVSVLVLLLGVRRRSLSRG